MTREGLPEFSYFPGCSLATTSLESGQSLVRSCELMGLELVEVEDWNCCGTSSAHALDPELALGLASRNLALAPPERPLLVMCPGCYKNLTAALVHLRKNPKDRQHQEQLWGRTIDLDLKVVNFLEIVNFIERLQALGAMHVPNLENRLSGMRVATYYGCMAMFPPAIRPPQMVGALLEQRLARLGARPVSWNHGHKCCGTFLSATRPKFITELVNDIMRGARDAGAECLVTACAMCQLNLEIRATLKQSLPVFHFSELMALALGAQDYKNWFKRHIVDPVPLLRAKNLIA